MTNLPYQSVSLPRGALPQTIFAATAVVIGAYLVAAIGYEFANRMAVEQLIENVEGNHQNFALTRAPQISPPGLGVFQRLLGYGQLSPDYMSRLQNFLELSMHSENSYVLPAWERLDGELSHAANLDDLEVIPRSKIAQLVKALDTEKMKADQIALLVAEQQKKVSLLHDRFSLLRSSLAELLGFSHLSNDNTSDTAVKFYAAGVLSELPCIEGIDDDIPDLPSLRDILVKLRATVTVSGPDAQDIFVNKLEQLRNDSRELALENTTLQKNAAELNADLENSKQKKASLRASLLILIQDNQPQFSRIRH